MENKLKKLFDYQRFEKKEKLEKLIDEAESRYSAELSDDDLSLVNAAGETGNGGTDVDAYTYGHSVSVTGPLCSDSYGGGAANVRAIGWGGLTLGIVFTDGRAAPCEIKHNGSTIGWAPWSSISLSEK